jgi:hypothetical protein
MPGLSAPAADVFDLCALVCWNDVPLRMKDVQLPTDQGANRGNKRV